MLLTGQPLHAFDLDRVAGARLTVRRAADGEQVETLDGQTRTLDGEMVVIEDAHGPTSIAGLMGGARSEVEPETSSVLLEVATWNGPNIHRTSWALGLRSEASARFEKGLRRSSACTRRRSPRADDRAVRRDARCRARSTSAAAPAAAAADPPARATACRRSSASRSRRERQAEILGALDFAAEPADDGLEVDVPALRRDDVTREIDLIEEVARIDGLERLPATLPARRGAAGRLTHAQRVRRGAEDALAGRGLHEIVGWSFTEPGLLDRLRLPADHEHAPRRRAREPALGGPLDHAPDAASARCWTPPATTLAATAPDIAIFESGTVYRARDGRRPAPTSTTRSACC